MKENSKDIEELLKEMSFAIKALARRYARTPDEIDDLESIGRIAIWESFEKGKVDMDRPEAKGYLNQAATWAMQRDLQKRRAEKRGGKVIHVSMDNHGGEDEFAPEQYLGVEGDRTNLEKIETMKAFMRKRFGRTYMQKLKKTGNKNIPPQVVRGLVEEVWSLDREDIPERVSYQLFVDSGMGNFLWAFYKNSPFRAIESAYPGEFFNWQFNRVPNGFFDGEEGIRRAQEAIKWFCNKQKINNKEDAKKVNLSSLEREGLGSILQRVFKDSPLLALRSVFPDLNPWETGYIQNGFLDSRENQLVLLGLVLQDLGLPDPSIVSPEEFYDHNPKRLRKIDFQRTGLRGLIARNNNCIYEVFENLHPKRTYPWFFFGGYKRDQSPRETGAKAIRWLFEEYLQIPKEQIPEYATNKLFWNLGFSGLLTRRDIGLNSSTYQAVNLAYPDKFSPEEFRRYKFKKYHANGEKDFKTKGRRRV